MTDRGRWTARLSGQWQVGARLIPGIPGMLPDFAMVWLTYSGRIFWCWDSGVGEA